MSTEVKVPLGTLYVDNLVSQALGDLILINCMPQNEELAVESTQAVNLIIASTLGTVIDSDALIEIQENGVKVAAYDEAHGGFQSGFTGTATRKASPGSGADDELWLTIQRTAPWLSQATVYVFVTAHAGSGASTLSTNYYFLTEDTSIPTIIEIVWLTPRRCRVRFSEPMRYDGELGSSVFCQHFTGGIHVAGTSTLWMPGTLDASWVGCKLNLTGSIYPHNNLTRTITVIDLATNRVTLDVSDGVLLTPDTGVDYDDAGNVTRRRAIRCTISPYQFSARLTDEGSGEEPSSPLRVQCAFEPQILSAAMPLQGDYPIGYAQATMVVLELDDDISLNRLYRLHAYNVEDINGNTATDATLDFTSPLFGYPADRQQLWDFFAPAVQDEDMLAEQQLRRMTVVLQDLLNQLWLRADGLDKLLDAWLCPEQLLDFLLHTLGSPFTFPIESEKMKRRLAEALPESFKLVGTVTGIEQLLNILLGSDHDFQVVPFWPDDIWVLGVAYLGSPTVPHTILGPSSAWLRNAYNIEYSGFLWPDELHIVRVVAEWMDDATKHLHQIIAV